MIKKIVLVVIMLFIIFVSCSKEPDKTYIEEVNRVFTTEFDGLERSYYVYVPSETKSGAPLLMMLHGFGATLEYFVEDTKLRELADRDKVILIYPQGTPTLGFNHWDANLDFNSVDDVGFLKMLVNEMVEKYKVNENLVFVGGHSNGGFMTYTLACEANSTFKAYMSVAGLMSGETWETCEITEETNLFQFHGSADDVVPIDGTMTRFFGWGGAPALDEMLEPWINVLNDFTLIESSINENISVKEYISSSNHIVMFVKAEGFGHNWAKDDELFEDQDSYSDISQLLWNYMMKFVDQ